MESSLGMNRAGATLMSLGGPQAHVTPGMTRGQGASLALKVESKGKKPFYRDGGFHEGTQRE